MPLPEPLPVRPPLRSDTQVDVCIVGAGFTGLWTAHALTQADPTLRIAIVEKEVAGFGASGRNGGWCSALFATSDAALARAYGVPAMRAMRRAMQDTVDVVGASAAAEGIDCHFAKGGTIVVARTPAQRARAAAEVDEARSLGFGEEDLRWVDATEAEALVGIDGVVGATFTPHCAAIQPALLARGLADAVERRGVALYEHSEVTRIEAGREGRRPVVHTTGGTVTAEVVVRAVEAWTSTLPGYKRTLAPVYSLMVATEPLDHGFWESAGLVDRATFADYRHMIIYGQRTLDGRIAFGGRGAPYHFGSTVRPAYRRRGVRPRPAAPDPHRALPRPGLGAGHPRLGWPAGDPAGLALLGRLRPGQRPGLGRGLCGRRRLDDQPGRADPGRPDHRGRHRPHPPAVGQPPLASSGNPSPCAGWGSTPASGR